ncbi:hypothetical protein HHK36_032856 [Tetracentron sinense]|uniref:YqaJ viral recombinase domain-containing protein n=1 Tax=Tetracentron sinense TaxID=13715 RepID=A0A835CWL6_TETSI|nr:hypothetical protein HHK36_032856 [Tetracentron sinense]
MNITGQKALWSIGGQTDNADTPYTIFTNRTRKRTLKKLDPPTKYNDYQQPELFGNDLWSCHPIPQPLPQSSSTSAFKKKVQWRCCSNLLHCHLFSDVFDCSTHPCPSSLILTAQLTPSSAPQRSEEWFALRRDKLTTSTFSTALGFWKGNRRSELWNEKVFPPGDEPMLAAGRTAMEWGVLNEAAAVERYKSITNHNVSSLGFAIHAEEQFKWLGASPDGLLGCCPGGGILEVKCPYNKGKPELGLPWSTVPFYYMPQVQGQMEIMDREWVDMYCWTPNGSTIFRVCRERGYWELIHGILREFWWKCGPCQRSFVYWGGEEDARAYKPASKQSRRGCAIVKSIKLAAEAKLVCRGDGRSYRITGDGIQWKDD